MPDKPTWMEKIPDAISDLLTRSDAMVDRKIVQELLDLKPRQAQRILEDAGATIEGKAAVISASEFCLYLDTVNGSRLVEEEHKRRQALAFKFSQMVKERKQVGRPLHVEVDSQPVRNKGYDVLPVGISFGLGCVNFSFKTPMEFLQQAALLSAAMQGDGDGVIGCWPEFEKRTGVSSFATERVKTSHPEESGAPWPVQIEMEMCTYPDGGKQC